MELMTQESYDRRQSTISIFESRKNFRLYAIVFFLSRPIHENFKFLKLQTIFIKFCTVILHPKGPLRARRHQNRMTGM